MHIPPRAKMSLTPPSDYRFFFYSSVLLSLCFVILLTALAFTKAVHDSLLVGVSIALALLNFGLHYWLSRLDFRIVKARLSAIGFDHYKRADIPKDIRETIERGEHGFYNDELRSAFIGKFGDQAAVASYHLSWSYGSGSSLSMRWVIRTQIDLPTISIRKKSLFVNYERELDEPDFDRLYSLSTQDEDMARELLTPLLDWFIQYPSALTRASRKHRSGNWLLDRNWVMLEDHGRTDGAGIIQNFEFVSAFSKQLEAQIARNKDIE